MVTKVQKKKWYQKWWMWLIIAFAVWFFIGLIHQSLTSMKEDTTETTITETTQCIPDWQCSDWIECSSTGTQTRTCTDSNNCGISVNKPKESQSCTPPKKGGIYFKGEPTLSPYCVETMGVKSCMGFQIVGELLNNGTRNYQNYEITIHAKFYKNDQIIDTDFTYADTDLPAGGTTSYKFWIMKDLDFDNYKLVLETGLL